ncbi:MAG: NUDIX hydrolase [Anaerorhabdus sp.]
MKKMFEKTLKKTLKYVGNVLRVREDEVEVAGGIRSKRDVIEHCGGVCIALKDTDGKYFMVEQFRYAQSKVMLEFPAGKLEENEDKLECVKREIIEEVGYSGKNFDYVGMIVPTPSYCQEIIYLYSAEVSEYLGQNLDEDEVLNVKKYSLDEILEMIMNKEIEDSKTINLALILNHMKNNG